MSTRFQRFPAGCVTIGGEIGERTARTADKILNHLDIENLFARHFRLRRSEPEVPGGFAGYGMLPDAMVKASAAGIGGTAMRFRKEQAVGDLIRTQTPDGAISIFSGPPGVWDNHEQAYIIQALVNDFLRLKQSASLESALRLGSYLIRRKSGMNLGLEEAFLLLYEASGERKFLEYCRKEFALAEELEIYDRRVPVNGLAHVYTFLARVLAQLKLEELTQDESGRLRKGAYELRSRILEQGYSSISGSCTGGRNWGEIWDRTQIGLGRWGETCASAYLLRFAAKMLERESDPLFGDLFERVMYNAFFGAQSEDGMRQRYFIPFNEPGEWFEKETYCCPNNLRRMMFEIPEGIFFRTEDGVAVNLYSDSVLTLPERRIEQKTGYPESGKIRLTVSSAAGFHLTLRIPVWCPQAEISMGGTVRYAPPGWFSVPLPAGETELELNFPMPVRLIRGTAAQSGQAAILRGPLVYALEQERNALAGHEVDLLSIDNSCVPVVETEGIRIPCVIQNRSRPRRDILFTRFSKEHRTRTYFPVRFAGALEEDPLYGRKNCGNNTQKTGEAL